MYCTLSFCQINMFLPSFLPTIFVVPNTWGGVGVEYRGYVIARKGGCNGNRSFSIDFCGTWHCSHGHREREDNGQDFVLISPVEMYMRARVGPTHEHRSIRTNAHTRTHVGLHICRRATRMHSRGVGAIALYQLPLALNTTLSNAL